MSFQLGTTSANTKPTFLQNVQSRLSVQGGDLTYKSVVVHAASRRSSPPLKSLTTVTSTTAQARVRPIGPKPGTNVTGSASSGMAASFYLQGATRQNTLSSSSSPDQAVSPLVNFDGLKALQNKPIYPYVYVPPDTEGDVGPNHYILSVNTIFAVYSKTGTLLAGPYGETALFAAVNDQYCGQSIDNGGDPIVKYDALADRWLFTYLSYPNGFSPGTARFYLCTAVSQSGDPTGAWWLYAWRYDNIFGSTQEFPDYPKYSVWPDGFYVTVNQFNLTNNPATGFCNSYGDGCYDGVGVGVFNRTQMESGADTHALFVMIPPGQGASYGCDFSFLPSDLNGAAPAPSTPNTLAELVFGYPTLNACYGFEGLKFWNGTVDWMADTFTVTSNSGMNLPTLSYNPDLFTFWGIPQRSPAKEVYSCPSPNEAFLCTDYLDPISDRLMYRLQYRDFGSYQSILATHTVDENGNNHAGVRWYELRNTGSGWFIYQQGDYAPDSDNRWMASIAQDSVGNIALCYSVSSTTLFPSIRCTAHLSGDPSGQMTQPEMTIMTGTGAQLDSANGPYQSGRWGDYSALQIDPSDDTTFWYTNEYYKSSGTATAVGWSTRIASFTLRSIVTIGLDLVAGWNLISIPLVPVNTQITALLAPLISSKNIVVVWSYSTTPRPSWVYFKPPRSGNLKIMVDGAGYWIFVNFATTLQVTGYIVAPASAPSAYPLAAGWNLMGFKPQPSIQPETVGQYLTSITTACGGNPCYDPNNIWLYNNGDNVWIQAGLAATIEPGWAMWILMTSPATLYPQ
jgi:hypothetical protein